MRILAGILSVFLWLLAGLFTLAALSSEAAAEGKVLPRAVVAVLLALGGLVMMAMAFRRAPSGSGAGGEKSTQEAPGELVARAINCPHCGGKTDATAMTIGKDGVMTVTCPFCKTAFFVQETPKW